MSKIYTSHGQDALREVTNFTFVDFNKVVIVETTGGIDCDNAGRAYSNETEITYQDLLWGVMNHLSFYGPEGIVSAVTGDTVDFHARGAVWSEVRITLPSDDPESFGTVYTVTKRGMKK